MPKSREIDGQLMDFLYGELSDSDAEQFRERLADDPDLTAEVEAFQRTREAFKALPVEEPPPAVSAQLLHEAAKRAPARKRAHTVEERPGFWAAVVEFFQPVLRHPAAASMAALLLVAGVAGALYLRGVDSPAHPNAASDAPAPGLAAEGRLDRGIDGKDGAFARIDGLSLDEAPGDVTLKTQPSAGFLPEGTATAEDNSDFRARMAQPEQEKALRENSDDEQRWSMNKKLDDGRRAGGGTRGLGEPLANAVSGADPLIVPDPTPRADPKPTTIATSRDKDSLSATKSGGKKGKAESQFEEKSVARAPLRKSREIAAPAKKPAPRSQSFDDDGDDFGGADAEADERSEMAQIATAPPPTTDSTTSLGGSAGDSYRAYKNRKDDQWAKVQHGKLNQTLDSKVSRKSKTKRCREAARIANDILDRNPEYYTTKVKGSKWLKPCSGFVASETTRRAKVRSKVGPGTGGKAAASKKKRSKASASEAGKAKAAPAEADAVEAE